MAERNFRPSLSGSPDSAGPGRIRLLNREDPGAYKQFSAGARYFALFPDSHRPPLAGFFKCSPKRGALLWAPRRIKGNLVDLRGLMRR